MFQFFNCSVLQFINTLIIQFFDSLIMQFFNFLKIVRAYLVNVKIRHNVDGRATPQRRYLRKSIAEEAYRCKCVEHLHDVAF